MTVNKVCVRFFIILKSQSNQQTVLFTLICYFKDFVCNTYNGKCHKEILKSLEIIHILTRFSF